MVLGEIMTEIPPTAGKITIAPEVLSTIAQLTTQNITGVSRLSQEPADGIRGILKRSGSQEGVNIHVQDDTVNADIHVILQKDVNVREVSRNIQTSVARAISEMVGMRVGRINIHIDDIDYQTEFEES
jgi:uncharacterized alkaline shock family protein YloU